ncbi:hypothetical protein RHMOL_Rhmol04G0137800 [Rhododendron molle]|uniref:Uncharacterized protein n=1 Tax=Rhododendron molle TaxID=49168 RepID=A0ACC0P0B1_RHOML|nr:hypothetical protein RHMOL_Rhmol04G0137800 [Rhododendron molle]
MKPTATGGSKVPVTPKEQVAVLPSEESVEKAMVNLEGFGLKSTGALGQHSHSPKPASPAVGSLPRNSIVMIDGVAFGWVGQHQGLEVKTPPPPGCLSPPKVSSGLSNTFAILQSTVFEDEQFIPAMEMASNSPLPFGSLQKVDSLFALPGSKVRLHSGKEGNKGLGSSPNGAIKLETTFSTLDSTVPLDLPDDPGGLVPNSVAPSLSECVVLVTLAECGARSVAGMVSGHEEGSSTQPVHVPVVAKAGKGMNRVGNDPWLQLGDFNVVRKTNERLEGFDTASTEFIDCLASLEMDDMLAKGFWYTWTNKRGGLGANMSKLDRAFVNLTWMNVFLGSWSF